MEKIIKWLKEEVSKLRGYAVIIDGEDGEWEPVTTVSIEDIYELINQLDKLEVLSQEWIDEYSNGPSRSQYVWVDDLQNLLVPKQDEREQLEIAYKDILERGEFWFDDKKYKVVEVEPKYYAKIKGHELTDHTRQYWYFFKVDESLNIGMKPNHPLHIGKLNKIEWANLGITNDNAEFELVEELEE